MTSTVPFGVQRFNTDELLCSVVGVGHARDKLTTIAVVQYFAGMVRSYA